MEFGALHWAECGSVFIMSPVSVRPDKNDFAAKEIAPAEIALPIIRYENLEGWNHSERLWRPAETDQMKRKRVWRRTRPEKSGRARGEGQRCLGAGVFRWLPSLQLVESGGVMRAANNAAEAGPEVDIANRRV